MHSAGALQWRGGIFAAKNITIQETGILTILDSQSDRGGGIFAEWITNKAGQLAMFLAAS